MAHIKPTGSVCERTGVYRAGCEPDHVQHFERGQVFPPCWDCDLGVDWTFVGTLSEVVDGGDHRPG